MDYGIKNPVFIIGVARSGTTILYNLLAVHPDTAWFSNYSNKFRYIPQAALFNRLLDVPLIGDKLKQNILSRKGSKLTPRPNEGEEIYQDYCNFPYNVSTIEAGQYQKQEEKFKQVVFNHLKYTGKPVFLSKQTANNRRLNLIDQMFPDARFVHIIRDGRAVANSLSGVEWWPEVELWWLDKKVSEWEGDRLAVALEYWGNTVTEILETTQSFGERCIQIRYDSLCEDTAGVIKDITNFLGISSDKEYLARLPTCLNYMNYKWKARFTEEQKRMALELIGPTLEKLGFPTD